MARPAVAVACPACVSKRKIELAEPADPAGLLRKLPRHVSFADYVDLFPLDCNKNKLREEMVGCLQESGLAGAILASTELTLVDGTQHTWSYLRPGAFLAKMCSLNGGFAELVKGLPKPLWLATRMRLSPATSSGRTLDAPCAVYTGA